MHNIYNKVLATYSDNIDDLSDRQKFHFANRLHLWNQLPIATDWLAEMRPQFTNDENPLHSLRQLLDQPLPKLAQTGELRQPYFERFPLLRSYERIMFRLLFLHTVYGIDSHSLLFQVVDKQAARQLYDDLLNDPQALCTLSSYAINYLYIFDHFDSESTRPAVNPAQLLEIASSGFTAQTKLERQLENYYYTHCILGETLFYARAIGTGRKQYYLEMTRRVEIILTEHFADTKLDVLYEYLTCCRILNQSSDLEPKILERTVRAHGSSGFITEPLSGSKVSTLQNSEHRNVLFLLSQSQYQPLSTILRA